MSSNDNDTSYVASAKCVANSLSSYANIIAGIVSTEITSQSALIALDSLNQSFSRLTSSIESMFKLLDVTEIRNVFEQCARQIEELTSPSYDFSSLTDNIIIEPDSVTLSNDAVETLTDFFDKTESPAPTKVKSKMSMESFLTGILIPIIIFILGTLFSYHQEQSNEHFQNDILALLAEHNQAIYNLVDSVNGLSSHSEDSEPLPPPELSQSDSPQSESDSEEVLPDNGTLLDVPDVPDSNE